jgi:hypothetical protein
MAEIKSGDKIIMHSKRYVPIWLDTFAGYVINVYRTKVSVRVPVDDNKIYLISKTECELLDS